MKSLKTAVDDLNLKDAVVAQLAFDPKVDDSQLRVVAKDGAVALTGSVTSYPEKWAAVRATEQVAGVQAVSDDIEVVLSDDMKRKDAEIAAEIARQRGWTSSIPESVAIEVSKGNVTLRGDVAWNYQRHDAARAVRHIAGVRGVSNQIRVKPGTDLEAGDVEGWIEEALDRMADLDPSSITVTLSNGTIRLEGTVHSVAERRLAQRAAESAPGVTEVTNELVVSP